MNCEDYKSLMPQYWDNSLDEADRLILSAHLERCSACRTESERLKEVWSALGMTPPEIPGEQMRTRFYDRLEAYRLGAASAAEPSQPSRDRAGAFDAPKRPFWSNWHIPAPALAFAMLAAGFFGGYAIDHRRDTNQLAQLHGEVNSMRQMVALSLLQQQNATDRLQGVSWANRVQHSDTEVLSALLATINHDPNVNVRIAAIEAMKTFADSPIARRGLAQSLAKQDSPIVAIALIDQIVDLKDSSARTALEALIQSTGAAPEVRERAQWALGQLK